MSEEFDQEETVVNAPVPEEFSLYDWVEGTEYPESSVTVARNERAAHQLSALSAEIDAYLRDGDPDDGEVKDAKLDEYRERVDKLRAAIDDSKVTFNLQGVPDDIVASANDIVEARFEDKKKPTKTADGRIVKVLPEAENINRIRFLNAVVISMHVKSMVEHGTGRVGHPDADAIAHFYDKAPGAAQAKLSAAVRDLRVEASEYERSYDEGFFQKS